MQILKIFSKKWILFTIVIVAAMVLFVRLGFWQLDRLEQKRTYNATMAERWRETPFDLNAGQLPQDLEQLEFRRIEADGYFDYANQVILKSQIYYDAPGIALVTPFVFADGRAILVARGWVPADQASPQAIAQLEEPAGEPIIGLIKPSQGMPNGEPSTPPATPQREWFRIDIPAIQAQMPYALEPGWIQQLPEEGRPIDKLPIREEPLALDDGNHMSYAVQWFSFALIAGFGYIMFVRYRERLALRPPVDPGQPLPHAASEAAGLAEPAPGQESPAAEKITQEVEPPVPA